MISFISKDISTKKAQSTDYEFTALFIDWFLSAHPEFEGIAYPSVKSEGTGFNIAIKPSLIDDEVLVFSEASECWLCKREKKMTVYNIFELLKQGDSLICNRHKEYDISLIQMYKCYPGLSFIN